MNKSNVKVVKSSKSLLSKKDFKQLEKWLNNLSINLQDYDRKERVSFYDDDMTFYFTLSLPVSDMADFDDSVMDLVDVFGGLFGITMASSKNGWF